MLMRESAEDKNHNPNLQFTLLFFIHFINSKYVLVYK